MYNHQLDAFIAASELGSFSKAAKALFITPAALIQQVNLLEERSGVRLFERSRTGVALTAAGESLYKDAVDIRHRATAAIERAREMQRRSQERIRIGTSLLTKCRKLPDLWMRIADGNPDIRMEIVSLRSPEVALDYPLEDMGSVIDMQEGLFLSENYADHSAFKLLSTEALGLALSERHPLFGKDRLMAADLDGRAVVIMERGVSHHFDVMHDWLENRTSCILETVRFYDMDVFTACEVEGKMLVSPSIWEDIHPSLKVHPAEEAFTVPYGLIYAKDATKAEATFLEAIEGISE